MPSHLGEAFSSLFGLNSNNEKYFIYIPKEVKNDEVILFLHGSGGNFQLYPKLWQEYAEKYKKIVVLPTFGLGQWDNPGGIDTIHSVIKDAKNRNLISTDANFTVVGLSGGGIGVSHLIKSDNDNEFTNIVYLSALIEKEVVQSEEFQRNIKNKNVLIIHGEKDVRTPIENVFEVKKYLKGQHYETKIYEEEDHFLFLFHQEEIFKMIDELGKDI